MKKNKLNILLSLFIIFAIGCEKDKSSEGISKLTFYAVFDMSGEDTWFLNLGETFTDPGVTAEENGVEIPVEFMVEGDFFAYSDQTVDPASANRYVITYSAENSDGYSAFIDRTVYVVETGNMTDNIAGLYKSTVVRNGAELPQYQDMEYVMIRKTGADTYELSDAIGGYYDIGRGYGAAFRAAGMEITANNIATNDFAFSNPITVGAWPEALEVTGMEVNATSKTIYLIAEWEAGYTFEVTLTQVTL